MSTRRVRADAGWVDNGKRRAVCRCGCGQAVPQGRRTFASTECVDRWKLQTQPPYVRQRLFERDHGICARCGTNAEDLRQIVNSLPRDQKRRACELLRLPQPIWTTLSYWQAHHKLAVVEGGGLCGLDGYETLCCTCHREETAALAARRAEQRRAQPRLEGL